MDSSKGKKRDRSPSKGMKDKGEEIIKFEDESSGDELEFKEDACAVESSGDEEDGCAVESSGDEIDDSSIDGEDGDDDGEDDDDGEEDDDDSEEAEDEEESDEKDNDIIDVVINKDVNNADQNDKLVEDKEETSDVDEYKHDSSDEEDARNTIGNIPIEWYKDKEHIGYDLTGKRIMKSGTEGDEIDDFIQRMEDPNYWRQVRDLQTNKKIVLDDEKVKAIRNFMNRKCKGSYGSTMTEFAEPFVRETMLHPVTNQPEHKRSFVPSKWERLKVSQLVHSIKMGWIKIDDKDSDDSDEEEKKTPKFYDIWGTNDEEGRKRPRQYIAPPKRPLPGNAESYNPPPEYLFTPEEEKKWNEMEVEKRRIDFVPQKYNSLRLVPPYERFVNEIYERCLDLYLCPRQIKMRAKVKMEDLLPKLPSPRDLQPFPTIQSHMLRGHTDVVRSITFDPTGTFLASGSDDCTIRLWNVKEGRCLKVIKMEGAVKSVKWHPKRSILGAVVDRKVFILSYMMSSAETFEDLESEETAVEHEKISVKWNFIPTSEDSTIRIVIDHPFSVQDLSWQKSGDYFCVVMPEGNTRSLLIHRLSTRVTMKPLDKIKGIVQRCLFHPLEPKLYYATKQDIRECHLETGKSKKFLSNCNWISSMSIHPQGEHMIIGSYDSRLVWFDLQSTNKPMKILKLKAPIREVTFHKTLPLFASCLDNGSTVVTHGRVYNDLISIPLIVPVKILRGHVTTRNMGVLDCQFHPREPALVTAGADSSIRVFR